RCSKSICSQSLQTLTAATATYAPRQIWRASETGEGARKECSCFMGMTPFHGARERGGKDSRRGPEQGRAAEILRRAASSARRAARVRAPHPLEALAPAALH